MRFDAPTVPVLAKPLVIRRALEDEAGALAALLGRAFEGAHWDASGTRRGFAKSLVIGVLGLAKEAGCREARLHTETNRLPAISLYLQLGFQPLTKGELDREVWERVVRHLGSEAV